MKKLIAILLVTMLIFSFAGCNGSTADTYELALITDLGSINDKSFNQGAWEGLEQYAEENNITYKYYQPSEASMTAYTDAIQLAVEGGAKVIVTPGYLFENPVHKAQSMYPEVYFILLDGSPHNVTDWSTMATYDDADPDFTIGTNTYSIFYKEQEAGFLAGYAAVKDGYTKLGFMGGIAVPAVIRYGYGFVQGAEYAAEEMGITDIELKYYYTGTFNESPEVQAAAASWYNSGTEVIFACGGAIGSSIMAAAAANNGYVIGVDVDQSNESETVINSAMKGLKVSVYDALVLYYADEFPGGTSANLGVVVDGVGLAMESSKLENFTQADYDAIYAALVADTDGIDSNILDDTGAATVNDLPLTNVTVTLVE